MNDRLRIGLIGAGVIGQKHAQYLNGSKDCVLVAIADPSPAAQAVASDHGVRLHADFETMFGQEQLDGVIIATPNDRHESAAVCAAEHGLAMIVEKPIAADLDAALRLTAAAERAGVPLLVGHHRRHDPRARRARGLIQQGALGRLVAVDMIWCVNKPDSYFELDWRRKPGGGTIMINLIHEIDMLRFLCGEIVELTAITSSETRGFEVADSVALTLRLACGALGSVLLSDAAPSPWSWEQATGENHPTFPKNQENPIRILGSDAAMEFPNLKLWRHDGPSNWHSPLTPEPVSLPPVDVYAEQIAHFGRVIRGEEAPIITGEDASRSLAATLAVLDAARSRSAVQLG